MDETVLLTSIDIFLNKVAARRDVKDFETEKIICGVLLEVKLSKNSNINLPLCITRNASVLQFLRTS